ncbi:MAG: 30S ribosomal protein S9 [Candidatus Altiarchaeota archaeon]|nr:30S ribosomal protein S9 [Candidatus Altiarchaeota archaeon]
MAKLVHTAGKRKESISRATVSEGKGTVRINSIPLEVYTPAAARMKIQEALMVAGDLMDLNSITIEANVKGGGVMGQADAIACAISRALIKWEGSDQMLNKYLEYDRTLIAGDSRQTEVHKPSQSSKGPRHKTQKSYR